MIEVVSLVETDPSAFVEGERRVGRRTEAGGRSRHRVGQRHAEMKELPALEEYRAGKARDVDAQALQWKARTCPPRARGLGPRRMRDGHVCPAGAQTVLEVRQLPGGRRE